MESKNELGKSTSPYLLQHANNPVHWKEWNRKTLDEAKAKGKPILLSIGYSSCHWCHVMEKESFEDTTVASLMNENFINIKVDREERPDVDQIYMDAVQTMGLRGGWPLNVFLTPDQKPFYGGTYFPKEGWINLLKSINEAFNTNRAKIDESADAFTKNLQLKESEKYKLQNSSHRFSSEEFDAMFTYISAKFDTVHGGIKKAPKFPMPAVWQFLAAYAHYSKNEKATAHFEYTLRKIADGGIYDHIGGGFARYSTDEEWHIPHFEKMLYDNAQLLSLYANGYKLTKNEQFKKVIQETAKWLRDEMLDDSGGFYSALDADSEGIEGKFYIWSSDEIKELVGKDYEWISEYFDIRENGNWEGYNALRICKPLHEIADEKGLALNELESKVASFKSRALLKRNERIRPGLDDKMIAGWNGLALTGLLDSYQAIQDSFLLQLASQNAKFIVRELIENHQLKRLPNKDIEGFLEDYASVIQAFIKYYETTLDYEYLERATALTKHAEKAFFDETEGLYFFTSNESTELIARKKEIFDNVIPSSNSMMAWNLVHLGTHLYDDDLLAKGHKMLAKLKSLTLKEPEYLSNWALLALEVSQPFAEVIIVGKNAQMFANEINQDFFPNKIVSASTIERPDAPFTSKQAIDGETTIYVCYDKACQRPIFSVKEASRLIQASNEKSVD